MSQLSITKELVRALVDAQFPDWRDETLTSVENMGTDNQLFRLGADKCVRLPRVPWAAESGPWEQEIMGRFAGLPLLVPTPLGLGDPALDYPWNWSIVSWVDGNALGMRQLEASEISRLAASIKAIHRVKPDMKFRYGSKNNGRGCPLKDRDAQFQNAATMLENEFDVEALRNVWARCLKADITDISPVFLHGDIHGDNLIEQAGHLSGLIDWGLAGVGDGACDLASVWHLCDAAGRTLFRKVISASDAEWLRGAGWALSIGCTYVASYSTKDAHGCAMRRRTIRAVLDDFA